MGLSRPEYKIDLPTEDGEGRTVTVAITHQDQLKGEVQARRYSIGGLDTHPMHNTTLWAWIALKRVGEYDGPFEKFRDTVVNIKPVDQDAEADPTQSADDTD